MGVLFDCLKNRLAMISGARAACEKPELFGFHHRQPTPGFCDREIVISTGVATSRDTSTCAEAAGIIAAAVIVLLQ